MYRQIPNSDFEGLAADPEHPDRLFAVTEDKVPWIVTIRLRSSPDAPGVTACIEQLSEMRFPPDVLAWRGDTNFRAEGIAISDDAKAMYVAFERADDDLPRLLTCSFAAAQRSEPVTLADTGVTFRGVEPRADKPGVRLNLNDIQFVRAANRPLLVGVARDQERILVIDLEEKRVCRWIELDLRDRDGQSIYWVSPEGLAVDAAQDRVWIINDPDSVRGNYRRRDEEVATGPYAAFAPLLFETTLSAVLGGAEKPARSDASASTKP